ncbi:MAG: pilus assembly protein N-terminal domain-containing protein [Xanthobacteraceae bacterium]|nr:pilus assembly protein N-terminal domain-containing protein [Xanthobacteraceae bacterium]
MAALCARGRPKWGPLHWLSAIFMSVALVTPAAAAAPAPAEPIIVMLDQAKMLQLPERAATVVVGNPLIADLSVQPGGLAVITGKSYGATNFIVTDKTGAVLLEKTVEVTEANDPTVVVYRGADDRETFSCTPDCSRRLTLGDAPEFFDKTLTQIASRNAQAAGAGAMASGH